MPSSPTLLHRSWLAVFAILIFVIPSNLFLNLNEQLAYVTGLRIDYLIPKLYLSDLIAWLFIICGWLLWKQKNSVKHSYNQFLILLRRSWPVKTLVVTSFILVLYQFITPLPIVSGWYLFHLVTAVLVGLIIIINRHRIYSLVILLSLVATIFFQALLAAYQFINQQSLGGFLFLGEVTLSKPFGIAHANFGGVNKALAYGTTAHPNVLAGVVILYTMIVIRWREKLLLGHRKLIPLSTLLCSFAVIYFTQSWSALLALTAGLISQTVYENREKINNHWLKKLIRAVTQQKKYLPHWIWIVVLVLLTTPLFLHVLSLTYLDNLSLMRRVWLNWAAIEIFAKQPALGTGFNLFTLHIQQLNPSREVVRFVQPVHHLGLLWLAETGLLGMIWLGSLLVSLKHHLPWKRLAVAFAVLLPIVVLDHYLLTIQTGRLLLAIFLVLMVVSVKDQHSVLARIKDKFF